nr:hypothetical protein CFP56_61789 [Quercus suber]
MWKPVGSKSCIALGSDFFLISFSVKEDYVKVLLDRPWFVGGHYLSIRSWEPNFKTSSANLSSVAIWVRLPKLPIEYYEPSVLKDIGKAIEPVLRIDTHKATEARDQFARLCVQVNLDKPIITLIKVGGIAQQVQYEASNGKDEEVGKGTSIEEQQQSEDEVFGQWVLVTQKSWGSTEGLPHQPYCNREKDLDTMECRDIALSLIPVASSIKGDGRDDFKEGENMEVQIMPLQGSTNHAGQGVGQRVLCLKTMAGNIFKANLKHIDPSLQSGVMLVDDTHEQEHLCTDGSRDPNSSLKEMVLEDGGEGYARAIGTATSVVAELWALRDGIRLCVALKLQAVIIELDAQTVVDFMNKDVANPNGCSAIVEDYKNSLRNIPMV